MKHSRWIPVLFTIALTLVATGCGDDSSGSDPSSSGTDDADAGVDCEESPAACLDIGEDAETQYFGCCFENAVYWCDDGEIYITDCDDNGSTCAYNSQLEAMWCM